MKYREAIGEVKVGFDSSFFLAQRLLIHPFIALPGRDSYSPQGHTVRRSRALMNRYESEPTDWTLLILDPSSPNTSRVCHIHTPYDLILCVHFLSTIVMSK